MRGVLIWAAPALLLAMFVVAAGLPLLVVRHRDKDLRELAHATAVDAALVASLAVVFALTILFEPGDRETVIRLVPFSKLLSALDAADRQGAREAIVDIVLNFGLFVPVGVAIALRSRRPSWLRFFLSVAFLSVAIEVTQATVLQGRTADSTDVITNVSGALLGFAAGAAAMSRLPVDLSRRRHTPA